MRREKGKNEKQPRDGWGPLLQTVGEYKGHKNMKRLATVQGYPCDNIQINFYACKEFQVKIIQRNCN